MRALGLATVTLFSALAGCTSTTGDKICTAIACESGLTTHLSRMPTAPFRVEVRVGGPASSPVYVFDCADATHCAQDIFFPGFVATEATVTVIVGQTQSTTNLAQIAYQVVRPNGPGCEPTCEQATVGVTVPA